MQPLQRPVYNMITDQPPGGWIDSRLSQRGAQPVAAAAREVLPHGSQSSARLRRRVSRLTTGDTSSESGPACRTESPVANSGVAERRSRQYIEV